MAAPAPGGPFFGEMPGSAHRARGTLAPAALAHEAGTEGREGAATPPLVLFEKQEGALRLSAVCEDAAALGLVPGLGLAEARSRFPAIQALEADPGADRQLLEAVADWCERWTPLVALDGARGLVLDISGCAHLFGGETAMLGAVLDGLRAQGLLAQGAIAAHAGTARALVGHSHGTILAAGREAEALGPLPVAALGLDAPTHALLARLGLKRIGELLALPRASLASRFGEGFVRRLDEAVGRARHPIGPRRPVPLLIHERRLFEPIARQEDLLEVAGVLGRRVAGDLQTSGQGARRLELSLFRVDGAVERVVVGLSQPSRAPARIANLFREKLTAGGDERDMGFGYDLIQLCVLRAEPLSNAQASLDAEAERHEPVEDLLDRLGARLGEVAVFSLETVESHRPERAEALRTALSGRPVPGDVPGDVPAGASLSPRPLRLLARPERVEATAQVPEGAPGQFRWRRAMHRVRHVEGPERIAPEWWRADAGEVRDYWRVEDEEGRRYWLFREGSYGDPTPPAWYLHGLFA